MNTINDSQISFGMRYKNPEKWGAKTLKTLINSDLRKEIDTKYPNAQSVYQIRKTKTPKDRGGNCVYHLDFSLKLDKTKEWNYKDSGYNSGDYLDESLARKLRDKNLNDIEKEIEKTTNEKLEKEKYIEIAKQSNKDFFLNTLKSIFKINK